MGRHRLAKHFVRLATVGITPSDQLLALVDVRLPQPAISARQICEFCAVRNSGQNARLTSSDITVWLTLPGVSQTVILTRTAMKASAMPAGEELASLGAAGATLAIHLSVRNLKQVTAELIPHYGAECPVAVVYRASWPDEQIVLGTLGDIRAKVRAAKITRTALILVGRVLDPQGFADSALYAPTHAHVLRPKRKA